MSVGRIVGVYATVDVAAGARVVVGCAPIAISKLPRGTQPETATPAASKPARIAFMNCIFESSTRSSLTIGNARKQGIIILQRTQFSSRLGDYILIHALGGFIGRIDDMQLKALTLPSPIGRGASPPDLKS